MERRTQLDNDLAHWQSKKVSYEKAVAEAIESRDKTQQEVANWTRKASTVCERIENPRESSKLSREMRAIEDTLKEAEKR